MAVRIGEGSALRSSSLSHPRPVPLGAAPAPIIEAPAPKLVASPSPNGTLPRLHRLGGSGGSAAAKGVLLAFAAIPAAMVWISPSAASATEAPRDPELVRLARAAVTRRSVHHDADTRELISKLRHLARRDFDGDVRAGFHHYAGRDQLLSRAELTKMLEDAGVGSMFTRGAWVDGIMERLDGPPDGNGDGKISWDEYEHVLDAES